MTKHEVLDKHGNRVDSEIVPDGGMVRVKMTMMDAAPPDVTAITRAALADHRLSVGHRPGYGVRAAATTDALEKAATDRDALIANAWRNPPGVQVADHLKPAMTADVDAAAAARDARVRDAWRGAA